MTKLVAAILLALVLSTTVYALYKGLIIPLVVKPLLKPKKPAN